MGRQISQFRSAHSLKQEHKVVKMNILQRTSFTPFENLSEVFKSCKAFSAEALNAAFSSSFSLWNILDNVKPGLTPKYLVIQV